MPKNSLSSLIYVLEKISDLKHLVPDGQDRIKTTSGKLSNHRVSGPDFKLILEKVASEKIASFNKGLGDSAAGWGSDPLLISKINWIKLEEYLKDLRKESDLCNGSKGKVNNKMKKRTRKSKLGVNTGFLKAEISEEREL